MFETQLEQSGLTKNQAIVYEALLKTGPTTARAVFSASPLKRGLVYKVLDELVKQGIALKKEVLGKVAIFEPAHPAKLRELAEQKEKQAQNAQIALGTVLGELTSNYNLASGKPGLRFYEGVSGIEHIYNDILATNETLYFVRTTYEPTYLKKILPITQSFVKKRVAKKIHAFCITPADTRTTEKEQKEHEAKDKTRLIDKRVWVDKALYNAPVEIDIYGNKVALISFAQELVGVIIESPQISQALRQIFTLAQLSTNIKTIPNTSVPH